MRVSGELDEKLLLAALKSLRKGNFTVRLPTDLPGMSGKIADTFNDILDTNKQFAHNLFEVSRDIGRHGHLASRIAHSPGSGCWDAMTQQVNTLIDDLVRPTDEMARVLGAIAKGDLSQTMALKLNGRKLKGQFLRTANTANILVRQLGSFASEVTRVAHEVGIDGKLGGQAKVRHAAGKWKELTDSVNSMATNLTLQVRNIVKVTTAVASGDLSKKITVDVRGEILQLKYTFNIMIDHLRSFSAEVTRVAREVGTEGKLGGQAQVKGVAGTWKDLTDSVNFMASNLTGQVRNIADVTTGVANGDLSKKITVEVKGEILELKNTINGMVDQLNSFASEVTRVAHEVGTEGKLGGQARVPGALGIWQDLTVNTNRLAANLTTQVRTIAGAVTAVAHGDMTRTIQLEAKGEMFYLKDNINEMIHNLRANTQEMADQNWLKTNLAQFSRLLQGQRNLETMSALILARLALLVGVQHSRFYNIDPEDNRLTPIACYGFVELDPLTASFQPGEGLLGQCAFLKKTMCVTDVPQNYVDMFTAMGTPAPVCILLLPILFGQQVMAVIELASSHKFTATERAFIDHLSEPIGIQMSTIAASSRTDELLQQAQSLAHELQLSNQELQEKAAQLALSSKYKSEFLANMSHELRTPLNSLLILAQQLSDNPGQNLSAEQVEYAKIILASGSDLLTLINDILNLSKIESGTVTLEITEYRFRHLRNYVERIFRHMAEARRIKFDIALLDSTPIALMTDSMRLQQILKNLLSNAFKFTPRGHVSLRIGLVSHGWTPNHPNLSQADAVVAFAVTDSGIGIPPDKLQLIFEAFQQAEGGTARKYGGTGLGLSISRELAHLLGGEILVVSKLGKGSVFTLFLPFVKGNLAPDEPLHIHDEFPDNELEANAGAAPELTFEPSARLNESTADDVAAKVAEDDSADDRARLAVGEPCILIVQPDASLADRLLKSARQHDFKAIVTPNTESALTLARDYQPVAILLDIDEAWQDGPAGLDRLKRGLTILDRLKCDAQTRHIPVHVLSRHSERDTLLSHGAISFLQKPLNGERLNAEFAFITRFLNTGERSLLLVEDNAIQRDGLLRLISDGINITAVANAPQAIAALQAGHFDCMLLNLQLADLNDGDNAHDAGGFALLDKISRDGMLCDLPVVIYTARDFTRKESAQIKRIGKSTWLKTVLKDALSPQQLLHEIALFLHCTASVLPAKSLRMLQEMDLADNGLAGKKVLIVDDDLRNIFALSSVLERQQMLVLHAENGHDGMKLLEHNADVEIVLMDSMMPEMDGYDTMRAIRKIAKFRSLPIISLTAKAMQGDRDKCIAAGASDYITKPVDVPQLLSLMRVWLYR